MADDLVRRLVAHHTGALVEADERGIGDLADEFPLPDQELLDALTYCDITTDPDGCRVGVEERLSEIMILRRSTPDRPEGMRWSRLTSAIRPQFLPWLKNRPDVPAYGASKAGGKLTFGELSTTHKACAGDEAKLQQTILTTLKGELTYMVEAGRLKLRNPTGDGLDLTTG